jgi:hypothetical protein
MTQIAAALFNLDAVEARSDLERFFLVRDNLPDGDLIAALEAKLSLGRDDYPVIPMWNAIVAGVVFQHESIEFLQRELSRNPSLLQACDFNVLPLQKKAGGAVGEECAHRANGHRLAATGSPLLFGTQ